jgi:chaperonin GroEL
LTDDEKAMDRVDTGIVAGGGVALVRTLAALANLQLEGEQQLGVNMIKRAIEEPLRWIAQNTGYDGSIVVEKVKNEKGNFGFNAQTETYEDMVAAGIIDPTKVVRCAIQNAASVASLLITTEALIADIPKKEAAAPAMPPMPPGGGMY